MKILNRWTDAVLWEGEAGTIGDAAIAALRSGANLMPIRDDIWAVLSAAPMEADALLLALREGRVDGSQYEGKCACLIGTIANARDCHYEDMPVLKPNASRPSERFFLGIHQGDTPATSQHSAFAEQWVSEWLTAMRAAFGAK